MKDYGELEERLRAAIGTCSLAFLLRLAFIDTRETSYQRDPALVSVFHLSGNEPSLTDFRIETRLLWIASAALVAGASPFIYGSNTPADVFAVLLKPGAKPRYSKALSFAGLGGWSHLAAFRGFVSPDEIRSTHRISRRAVAEACHAVSSASAYGLHLQGATVVEHALAEIREDPPPRPITGDGAHPLPASAADGLPDGSDSNVTDGDVVTAQAVLARLMGS